MGELDGPWKAALDVFFQPFMAFCFPAQYAEIRWSAGVEMLEQELQQLVADSRSGRRTVDKLVRVTLNDGQQECVLVHVEVQNRRSDQFAERMFEYHYRLLDRLKLPVASLAVLGDQVSSWRPHEFYRNTLGCELSFRFPIVKLTDFSDKMLVESENPFAALIYAHRGAMETAGKSPDLRLKWKLSAVRLLLQRGHDAEDVRQLFRVVDWLLDLPPLQAQQFRTQVKKMETQREVPFVSSLEREALEEGLQRGFQQGRGEGIEQGREEGALIGRIHTLQEVLGQPVSETKSLVGCSLEELRAMADELAEQLK